MHKILKTFPVVFLLLALTSCQPRNIEPWNPTAERQNLLLDVKEWLEYAEEIRVEVLTSVRHLYDQQLISRETVEQFREIGKAVEKAQHSAASAKRTYVLATSAEHASAEEALVLAINSVRDQILELERLWAKHQPTEGGGN